MEKEIKDLYVIDSKELQRKIDEAKKNRDYFFESKMFETSQRHQGIVDGLLSLQQSLSPLEPVLEKAFNDGREGYHNASETILGLEVYSEYEYPTFQDFLNKPIEL